MLRCHCQSCTRERRDLRRLALRGLCVASLVSLACLFLWLATGCGRQEAPLTTGRVIPAGALPQPTAIGDAAYAELRADALPLLYENFRALLSRQGLVRWDDRFDCNKFAALYVSLAQVDYAVEAWHSRSAARSLALAPIWYTRDTGGRHAIVQAITEQGAVFIDPQNGRRLVLSDPEIRSIYFRQW